MSQYVRSDSSVTTFMVRVLYRNGYRNTGPVKMHSGAKIYFIHFAVFLTENCNAFGYSMNNRKKNQLKE